MSGKSKTSCMARKGCGHKGRCKCHEHDGIGHLAEPLMEGMVEMGEVAIGTAAIAGITGAVVGKFHF